mmetsp:Transcript_7051/g.10139  ORF Transcript_7051/g.10139 Transcript_7051/m.10139 type:complete len:261 (+) Transcript_7051:1379-2161(+)
MHHKDPRAIPPPSGGSSSTSSSSSCTPLPPTIEMGKASSLPLQPASRPSRTATSKNCGPPPQPSSAALPPPAPLPRAQPTKPSSTQPTATIGALHTTEHAAINRKPPSPLPMKASFMTCTSHHTHLFIQPTSPQHHIPPLNSTTSQGTFAKPSNNYRRAKRMASSPTQSMLSAASFVSTIHQLIPTSSSSSMPSSPTKYLQPYNHTYETPISSACIRTPTIHQSSAPSAFLQPSDVSSGTTSPAHTANALPFTSSHTTSQ